MEIEDNYLTSKLMAQVNYYIDYNKSNFMIPTSHDNNVDLN